MTSVEDAVDRLDVIERGLRAEVEEVEEAIAAVELLPACAAQGRLTVR